MATIVEVKEHYAPQQIAPAALFRKGDLVRYQASEFPAGFVRHICQDAKGIYYIVGFGRGRSRTQSMARETGLTLVLGADEPLSMRRARPVQS